MYLVYIIDQINRLFNEPKIIIAYYSMNVTIGEMIDVKYEMKLPLSLISLKRPKN